MLLSSKHSDVSIYLGPEKVEFRAHYAILSVHTRYFDAAKEKGFAEALENKFYFPEGHPYAFYRVLQYIYTGDYSMDSSRLDIGEGNYPNRIDLVQRGAYIVLTGFQDDDGALLKHLRVNAIMDFFDVQGLRSLCATSFTNLLYLSWDINTFVDSVFDVYSMTTKGDDAFRKAIVNSAIKNLKELYKRDDFKSLITEHGEFSGELLTALLEADLVLGSNFKSTQCINCCNRI